MDGIDNIWWMGPWFPRGRISTACAILVLKNDRKCKCMFTFTNKYSACKELIDCRRPWMWTIQAFMCCSLVCRVQIYTEIGFPNWHYGSLQCCIINLTIALVGSFVNTPLIMMWRSHMSAFLIFGNQCREVLMEHVIWWPLLALLCWYPAFLVKSLHLIWRSGSRRWNLRVPDLHMSCSDLTKW